jgi:hypothetical protein
MKTECDSAIESLLSEFAVHLIKRIALRAKLDPEVVASCVPGLVHAHNFVADDGEIVAGCLYCSRRERLGFGNAASAGVV